MLSCRVLSHRPELLPLSYIRHFPAEHLFANTVREKHVSHREKKILKQTRKHGEVVQNCVNISDKDWKYSSTQHTRTHEMLCNMLIQGTPLRIQKYSLIFKYIRLYISIFTYLLTWQFLFTHCFLTALSIRQ